MKGNNSLPRETRRRSTSTKCYSGTITPLTSKYNLLVICIRVSLNHLLNNAKTLNVHFNILYVILGYVIFMSVFNYSTGVNDTFVNPFVSRLTHFSNISWSLKTVPHFSGTCRRSERIAPSLSKYSKVPRSLTVILHPDFLSFNGYNSCITLCIVLYG